MNLVGDGESRASSWSEGQAQPQSNLLGESLDQPQAPHLQSRALSSKWLQQVHPTPSFSPRMLLNAPSEVLSPVSSTRSDKCHLGFSG